MWLLVELWWWRGTMCHVLIRLSCHWGEFGWLGLNFRVGLQGVQVLGRKWSIMEHGDSKAQVKGGRSLSSAIRANTGCGPMEQVWRFLVFLGLCFMLFILGLVKGVEILQWSSTSSCLPHQFAIFGFRLFFISLSFFQIMLELYVRFKNKISFFGFFLGFWLGWVIFCHVFAELGLHITALWVFLQMDVQELRGCDTVCFC